MILILERSKTLEIEEMAIFRTAFSTGLKLVFLNFFRVFTWITYRKFTLIFPWGQNKTTGKLSWTYGSYLLSALYARLTGIFTLYHHIIISIKIDEICKIFRFRDGPKPKKLENIIIFYIFSLFKCYCAK